MELMRVGRVLRTVFIVLFCGWLTIGLVWTFTSKTCQTTSQGLFYVSAFICILGLMMTPIGCTLWCLVTVRSNRAAQARHLQHVQRKAAAHFALQQQFMQAQAAAQSAQAAAAQAAAAAVTSVKRLSIKADASPPASKHATPELSSSVPVSSFMREMESVDPFDISDGTNGPLHGAAEQDHVSAYPHILHSSQRRTGSL
jgi:hypothetical protein